MTIRQQGGIFGRNPTFNEVGATTGNITTVNATTANVTTVDATTVQADGIEVTSASGDIDMLWAAGSVHKVGSDYAGLYFTGMRVAADTRNVDLISLDPSGTGNFRVFTGTTEVERLSINPSGNVTVSTGNLVIGTSGAGIDFSATSGTGTSELFDDYEEGTWTPAFSAEFTTAPTVTSAQYTKVGRQVTVTMLATGGVVTAGGSISGLPFASNASQGAGAYGGNSDTTENLQGTIGQSASSITNIPARTLTGDTWQITATYFT